MSKIEALGALLRPTPSAATGADVGAAPVVTAGYSAPPPTQVTSTAGTIAIGAVVLGLFGGIGYLIYKDEERLSKMSPADRHQERMDRLKEQVAYSLLAKV
jgi:hypothetical protein